MSVAERRMDYIANRPPFEADMPCVEDSWQIFRAASEMDEIAIDVAKEVCRECVHFEACNQDATEMQAGLGTPVRLRGMSYPTVLGGILLEDAAFETNEAADDSPLPDKLEALVLNPYSFAEFAPSRLRRKKAPGNVLVSAHQDPSILTLAYATIADFDPNQPMAIRHALKLSPGYISKMSELDDMPTSTPALFGMQPWEAAYNEMTGKEDSKFMNPPFVATLRARIAELPHLDSTPPTLQAHELAQAAADYIEGRSTQIPIAGSVPLADFTRSLAFLPSSDDFPSGENEGNRLGQITNIYRKYLELFGLMSAEKIVPKPTGRPRKPLQLSNGNDPVKILSDNGNCRGLREKMIPEPDDEDGIEAAKAVCEGCKVSKKCGEYAMSIYEKQGELESPVGVWGGHTIQELRQERDALARRIHLKTRNDRLKAARAKAREAATSQSDSVAP